MTSRKIIPTLLTFMSLSAFAQSKCDCFNRVYHLSQYYDDRNDTLMSIASLKDAISFLDASNAGDYYWLLARKYATYGNVDSSTVYYTKAILYSGDGLSRVKEEYPAVYARMDTIAIHKKLSQQKSNINIDLYKQFISAFAIDQGLRSGLLLTPQEMFDTSSAIKTLVNNVFYRADSTSFELIRFVLDKYGYPTYKKLGFPTSDLHVLIMHTTTYDNAWSNYILNKLEQLNATCDFPEKSQLLFLIDRQRIRQGKKSLAGLSGGSRRYFTIEDIKKVDSIRFSYNLLRLKDENYPGDSLPDNYQPQPYPANYFCGKKYRID